MNPIVASLARLTPYDIDIGKRRIGPRLDGGYVFADCLTPDQSVLSYGISTEYRFDAAMAAAGHRVFMFDHTIAGIARTHDTMQWFPEGVAGRSQPEKNLYTVADHLARHGIEGDRLILKMDVEGAEFEALGMMPPEALDRFDQIVVEIHRLGLLGQPEFRRAFDAMLDRLNAAFTLFHVHANNYNGPNGFFFVEGLVVTNVIELSFIRTARVARRPSRTLYPTEFDHPNCQPMDQMLWFFPFLPTHLTAADFAACADRLHRVAQDWSVERG